MSVVSTACVPCVRVHVCVVCKALYAVMSCACIKHDEHALYHGSHAGKYNLPHRFPSSLSLFLSLTVLSV